MLNKILTTQKCAECQICCSYTDDDIWDRPVFTSDEVDHIQDVYTNVKFERLNQLFTPAMEMTDLMYNCPFILTSGCILKENKPFKCQIWPLYIVNHNGIPSLKVSTVCSFVSSLSDQDIIEALSSENIEYINGIIKKYPELIEYDKPHFRFIRYLNV